MHERKDSTFTEECQEHLNWMQSLLTSSQGAAPTSASHSTNTYQSQIDDLIASIEKPIDPVRQPKISDVCAQYQGISDSAYRPSIEPSPLNPARPEPAKETKQYRISDPVDDSEEDSDCEDYYVEDAEEIRGQEIPDWARKECLLRELESQQGVDPDRIFSNFEKTCDLSELFEKKKKCFKVRGDSGWWAADGVTPAEELNYKKAVGLA